MPVLHFVREEDGTFRLEVSGRSVSGIQLAHPFEELSEIHIPCPTYEDIKREIDSRILDHATNIDDLLFPPETTSE